MGWKQESMLRAANFGSSRDFLKAKAFGPFGLKVGPWICYAGEERLDYEDADSFEPL